MFLFLKEEFFVSYSDVFVSCSDVFVFACLAPPIPTFERTNATSRIQQSELGCCTFIFIEYVDLI